MTYYRLYVLHPGTSRIINFEELQATSDEEAMSMAAARDRMFAVELWAGARLVAQFNRQDSASSGSA